MSIIKQSDLNNLHHKKIALLGLGIENYALAKYLLAHKIKCVITICDARSEEDLGKMYSYLAGKKNVAWRLGNYPDKHLDGFDILFRSPGWPLFDYWIVKAKKMGVLVTSPMKLFFELCPTENIIGVTGTKGKGTTASLIHAIIKGAGKKVWLGGNIGIAPFSFIDKIRATDWVVLELSSFQLEDLKKSPHIGVMTNFFREHLAPADPNNPNYHKNIHEYWMSKMNIIRWQRLHDYAVLNKKSKTRLNQPLIKTKSGNGKKIFFTQSGLPSRLVGAHNRENIAAAMEVAKILNIKENVIAQAIMAFKGLEHRLEPVANIKGVQYYDDSLATMPEPTMTALRSFDKPIVLLAGGAEKNANFSALAKEIKKRVKYIVLFKGAATPRLKKSLIKAGYNQNRINIAGSMTEAIKIARQKAKKNDIVLLSPACASFGLFKNYKERGNQFKKEVKKIILNK